MYNTHTETHRNTHKHTHMYIYIMFMSLYMCIRDVYLKLDLPSSPPLGNYSESLMSNRLAISGPVTSGDCSEEVK